MPLVSATRLCPRCHQPGDFQVQCDESGCGVEYVICQNCKQEFTILVETKERSEQEYPPGQFN